MRLTDADVLMDLYANRLELLAERYGLDSSECGVLAGAMKLLEAQPTIEERKTGKWIKNSNGTYSCDKCHSWIPNEQHYYANFCLYCGADMRGEQDGKNT